MIPELEDRREDGELHTVLVPLLYRVLGHESAPSVPTTDHRASTATEGGALWKQCHRREFSP